MNTVILRNAALKKCKYICADVKKNLNNVQKCCIECANALVIDKNSALNIQMHNINNIPKCSGFETNLFCILLV